MAGRVLLDSLLLTHHITMGMERHSLESDTARTCCFSDSPGLFLTAAGRMPPPVA